MITFTQPTDDDLRRLAERLGQSRLSYEPGLVERVDDVTHWFVDRQSSVIGHGQGDFAAAETALRNWAMFDQTWAVPVRPSVRIEVGNDVTYAARVLGVWWSYGCRILDVIDERDRFGFVYGTLRPHAERGEERFLLELDESGDVVFSLLAISRPGRWFSWPGLGIARWAQRRFRRDAPTAMRRAVVRRAQEVSA